MKSARNSRFSRPTLSVLLAILLSAMLSPIANAQSSYGQSAPRTIEAPKGDAKADGKAPTGETVRPEIVKPLQAAEKFNVDKKFKETLEQLVEAEKVPNRTPYEQYMIDRLRASAALGLGEDATAVKSLEAAYATGRIGPDDNANFLDAIARIHYRMKNYKAAAEWAGRAAKVPGARIETRLMFGHAAYITEDFANAFTEISAVIAENEKAGKPVAEDQIRLMASAALKLKNDEGYVAALERLAVAYPKKEYWVDLIYRVQVKPTFAERLLMDVYRLRLAAGTLDTARDFLDMAQQSMQQGLPTEADKILNAGEANGGLNKGPQPERLAKLRASVNKELADERARAAKPAPITKTATAYMNNGFDAVLKGEGQKGLELMEAALKMPDLKRPDDAKLRYGIAQVLAGQKTQAVETFKTVQGTDGAADLARVWSLFARSVAK